MLNPGLCHKLAALEGLISEDVGLRLAELASTVPTSQIIVEIGSYKGKSACYLAAGAPTNVHVYAIDAWDHTGNPSGRFGFAEPTTFQTFLKQVEAVGLQQRITAIRAFSHDAARLAWPPIGMLYVDGSHTAEDVQRDVDAWTPLLAAGAVIAFDDYNTPRNPGVKKVVDMLPKRFPKSRWVFGPAPLMVGRLP